MTTMFKDRDRFLIGVPFIGGGVIFLLLAFGSGIITATNTARANVALARIDERATICFDAATAYLSTPDGQGQAPASADLVAQFVTASGDKRTDTMVGEACRKKLNT